MCPDLNKYKIIADHYNKIARTLGDSSTSTMEDQIIRQREIQIISNFFQMIQSDLGSETLKILDVGCGNGFTLNVLGNQYEKYNFFGIDLTEEFIAIASKRKVKNAVFMTGDVRKMSFEDRNFDVVFSERCLINILDWEGQKEGLTEIARVLKPKGYYLMIEAFSDGLNNNNKARSELGLEEIKAAFHNEYFVKDNFLEFIKSTGYFTLADPVKFPLNSTGELFQTNFLSSHYFFARVLHPLITKGDANEKNTEFVKFFSHLPPFGNYSPVQAYILKRTTL